MKALRINDAASQLDALVESLPSTGDVFITRGDEPVARLTAADVQPSLRDHTPSSVGAILRPIFTADDDLLADMMDT